MELGLEDNCEDVNGLLADKTVRRAQRREKEYLDSEVDGSVWMCVRASVCLVGGA